MFLAIRSAALALITLVVATWVIMGLFYEDIGSYLKWSEFFEGLPDVKPVTKITDDNGARFIYRVKMLGLKVTVGTEFQQFKKNESWIGK